MRAIVVAAALVAFLTGCGGGSGGEATWQTTPLAVNDQVSGSLTAESIQAPDGTLVDLYTLSLPAPTDLTISLQSAAFDTVLYLLEDAVLGEPDLNSWDQHLLAYSDDFGPGTNSAMTIQLPAGTYVIAVNSFAPATGLYLLTTATMENALTLSRPFVQFRTFETPSQNRFMGWIDCRSNGALLQPGDLLTARLYDPQGMEVIPSTLAFISEGFTVAAWNPLQAAFDSIGTDGNSGLSFNLANQANLGPGLYTIQVETAQGGLLSTTLDFPGKVELPAVASSSMVARWNQDGSLTLSWSEPPGGFDQYRVYLADANGQSIFYGRVTPGVSAVTLQAPLVAQISQFSQLQSPTTVTWTMQTRNYLESNNYARGVSAPVAILWPGIEVLPLSIPAAGIR